MKLFLLSIVLCLSGCFYQTVSIHDIERAKAFCEKQGSSLEEIEATFFGVEVAHCTNRKFDDI